MGLIPEAWLGALRGSSTRNFYIRVCFMKKSALYYLFVTIAGLTAGLLPINIFAAPGDLFESDQGSNTIFKFTPAGAKSTFATGLGGPFGLAVDGFGNVFEANFNNGMIFKFTPAGVKSTFASGLNMPVALAFDASGNLFEADHGSNKIFKFTPAGVKSTFASGLNTPTGLAFDASGNLFEADQGSGTIFKFTPAGAKSTFASGLNEPSGLAFEPPTAQLVNISTRASVKTGAGVTIGGFIVTGTASKQVVVRGLGPTLGQPPFNVPNVLADPTLNLHDSTSSIATNDNWRDTQQAAIQATGLAPPNDAESAILITLQPGNYTAILAGKNGTTGVGLVEVYDINAGVFAELTNVSTRGFVGTGDNVMIGGFITQGGNGSTQVLVRGLGPTLAQSGISGVLADPFLRLFDGNGNVLYTNNNWKDTQQAAIQATGLAPPNDLEAAILVTVAAGHYTAILSGNGGGTGIGLVEIYKLR